MNKRGQNKSDLRFVVGSKRGLNKSNLRFSHLVRKKGMSTIITTVIMVALALVAVGIVWAVVSNILYDTSEETASSAALLRTSIDISGVQTDGQRMSVVAKRNVDGGYLDGINFLVTYTDGSVDSFIPIDSVLDELESKRFVFDTNGSKIIDSVIAVPFIGPIDDIQSVSSNSAENEIINNVVNVLGNTTIVYDPTNPVPYNPSPEVPVTPENEIEETLENETIIPCGGSCSATQTCTAGICVDNPPACVANCSGKTCGDDGCGGTCGICSATQTCTDSNCVDVCQPDCSDKTCGDDGCGASCGTCDASEICSDGSCVCQSSCDGAVCGQSDGCGGTCSGTCSFGVCQDGSCVAIIDPETGEWYGALYQEWMDSASCDGEGMGMMGLSCQRFSSQEILDSATTCEGWADPYYPEWGYSWKQDLVCGPYISKDECLDSCGKGAGYSYNVCGGKHFMGCGEDVDKCGGISAWNYNVCSFERSEYEWSVENPQCHFWTGMDWYAERWKYLGRCDLEIY